MSVLDTVNIEEVKLKLYQNLKPSGWGDKLKSFILSSDFDKILNALLEEAKQGKRFTPVLKQVFRAFECCPLDKLKVVVLGQDPFPQMGVADGLAFSCSNTNTPQPSLKYIFKALEDTMYPDGYTGGPDLKRWSEQGILLLNSALTTELHKTGTHYALWRPFLVFLFDYLVSNHAGLVYVYFGKKAQEWADHIPEDSFKLFASHPASAAYQELEKWDCSDIFRKVQEQVKIQFNEKIVW
jgi:uracil-DNA glycosylase